MTPVLNTLSALLVMSMPIQAAAPTEAQAATPQPAAATAPRPVLKPERITDRNHPDYVRCRREAVIGSRARYTKRCFTNREWEQISSRGNETSRQIVADAATMGG